MFPLQLYRFSFFAFKKHYKCCILICNMKKFANNNKNNNMGAIKWRKI